MRLLLFIFAMLSFFNATSQLSIARIFGDHMVLQRDKPLPIWGWSKPGQPITVQLNGATQTVKTSTTGRWNVEFPAFAAGGPYTMTIRGNNNTLSIQDLYIGEVWLCSGQSNMEWPLAQTNNAVTEIKRAKDPKIRHIKLETDLSLTPKEDLPPPRTGWTVCSPKTAPEFSAIGYFFAQQLRERLGEDIAIGLVNSSWGGSQLESWISKEGMSATEALQSYAADYPDSWEKSDIILKKRIQHYCFGNDAPAEKLLQEDLFTQPGYDFSPWPSAEAPLSWDWQGMWAFRGNGYMARYLDIPEFLVDSVATIYLGESDQPMRLWLNGKFVQLDTTAKNIKAILPAGTFKTGKNDLMIFISAQKDPEWWGMGLHGRPDDLRIEWPDFNIPLAGEQWHIMPSWNTPYKFARLQNNVAATLYNAMIYPLVPMALRGALWYQGESNADRADQYGETFPAMIKDWRRAWGEDFPFYFVQLTSFGKDASSNEGSNWAELREAQTKALALPQTAMAVILDIGNPDDIHPRNKKDVGNRLALAALQSIYGKEVASKSPSLLSVTWEAASAVLQFEQVGAGLVAKDKYGYVRGFEIAGEDHKFYYAQAQIINTHQIVVQHPEGVKPIAIRYAWSDAPTDANVFNANGLPLGTFRTDDWKGKTVGKKFE